MNRPDDYLSEMFQRGDLSEGTIEELLAGQPVEGLESFVAFVDDARLAGGGSTRPNAQLTQLFTEGFSMDKGDLSVTAASNVLGPAPQVAALPKWRPKKMFELVLGKLVALGAVAKTGAAAAALTVSTTTIAATGVLPDSIQDPLADTVVAVSGVDIAGGTTDKEKTKPEEADMGAKVSDAARSGAPQEDGQGFGQGVAVEASEGRSEAGLLKAEEGKANAPEAKPAPSTTAVKAPVARHTPSTTAVKAPVAKPAPTTTTVKAPVVTTTTVDVPENPYSR